MSDLSRDSIWQRGVSRRQFLQGLAAASGAVAFGAVASACGSSSAVKGAVGTSGGIPSALGSPPASLSMLYAGSQSDAAALQSALPMLKNATGITIQVENLPYNALQQKTFSELATGTPAHDIYIVDTPWTPTLTKVLEPLGPYLVNATLNKGIAIDVADFIPKVFYDTTVYQVDNPSVHYPDPTATVDVAAITAKSFAILGLPIQGNALTMAYRKDLFDSVSEQAGFHKRFGRALTVPRTWDEFTQVASYFTRPGQHLYGTTLMAGVGDWDIDDFKTIVGSFGGDGHLISAKQVVEITTPTAIAALQYYVDLINKYKVTPPGTTAASWDTVASSFSAGLTAMTMNYTPQTLNSNVPGKIGYAMVPKKVTYAPHFGTWQLSVPAAADATTKAWAYRAIAWLTSGQAQTAMLAQELHPTRISVFDTAIHEASISQKFGNFYPILSESLAHGVGRARVKEYAAVTQPIAVGVNDAATRAATPARAMAQAAAGVERILDSYGYHASIAR